MNLTDRQQGFLKYAKQQNREGHPISARYVVYQLLNIANDRIGVVQYYWQLTENPVAGEEPLDWTPNDSRDQFARVSKDVLEKRVERTVILHPEKRRAAKIFEGFVGYAS